MFRSVERGKSIIKSQDICCPMYSGISRLRSFPYSLYRAGLLFKYILQPLIYSSIFLNSYKNQYFSFIFLSIFISPRYPPTGVSQQRYRIFSYSYFPRIQIRNLNRSNPSLIFIIFFISSFFQFFVNLFFLQVYRISLQRSSF